MIKLNDIKRQQNKAGTVFYSLDVLYKSRIVLSGQVNLPRTWDNEAHLLRKAYLDEPWIAISVIIYLYTDMVYMQSETTAIGINVSCLHIFYRVCPLFKMKKANVYSRYKKCQDCNFRDNLYKGKAGSNKPFNATFRSKDLHLFRTFESKKMLRRSCFINRLAWAYILTTFIFISIHGILVCSKHMKWYVVSLWSIIFTQLHLCRPYKTWTKFVVIVEFYLKICLMANLDYGLLLLMHFFNRNCDVTVFYKISLLRPWQYKP